MNEPTVQTRQVLETRYLGRVPYAEGQRLQEAAAAAVKDGTGPQTLFLLEHDPVLTLGRNAHRENITASTETLTRLGIDVHECGRGGDVTYHGPGQLVGYPVINLAPDRKDVGKYVRGLEEALMLTLADYGVPGERIRGLTGVWVGNEKIAAIGVRISRWVTTHGFALNVTTNLDHFRTIVPCGIRGRGVTSLERLLPHAPSLEDVAARFAPYFAAQFDRTPVWTHPAPGAPDPAGKEASCPA